MISFGLKIRLAICCSLGSGAKPEADSALGKMTSHQISPQRGARHRSSSATAVEVGRHARSQPAETTITYLSRSVAVLRRLTEDGKPSIHGSNILSGLHALDDKQT